MSLEIQVLNATNIRNVETFGKTDPYVRLEFQGQEKKTEVKKDDLNPVYDEKFEFDLRGQQLSTSDVLKVQVKDWEMVGRNRLLGQATVALKDFSKPGKNRQQLSLRLKDGNNRETECVLNLGVTYKPPPGAPAAGAGTGTGAEAGAGTVVEQDEADEEEEEEEYEDIDPTPGPDGTIPPPKKKKKRTTKARKSRGPLSTKAQDYQVRIKIVEARQLPGANISPISRVTCYNQTKQTRVQNSTNSPFWNEVFYFNYFVSPAELFDEVITFGVYNSRKLRSDAFIGSFKCDIGMIYDEPSHSLLNKWLLLCDPDDSMAGAKGYLKISATVLGAGDEAPSFKSLTKDEEEDIEANLLRPAGVNLRPATFALKVYRAEDLPRMDSDLMQGVKKIFGSSEKKELVDPYFTFSFAGKEVQSKILYNCENPEWNQELRLGLRFPSMCERIKLQMFDWDRLTESDVICETRLDLRSMSRPADEEGFLPTFGPCFVNFYGSPREFSELPDEYENLNLGKGEGVAYRGRALVELTTTLGELPDLLVQDINNDDVLRVQKFMRRRKFRLHAAFLNATMVSAIDAPVEFEVSIGNYGNKLDESVPPCSSTTQPTNAVFDGCFYYFLPWGDTKPCCVVDSHWEDISFRLHALNLLLHMADRLEENLNKVKVAKQANLPAPELAQLIIQLLKVLVDDTSKPLPKAQAGQHVQNTLDTELSYYRQMELEYICTQARKLHDSATDADEAVHEVENYLALIKNLAVEPQNSIPDVVIWMISGDKRVAYYRCPAHLVLWSENPDYRGKLCGKLSTIQLKYPDDCDSEKKWGIPALVRVKVWLGLERDELHWHEMQTEGELAVFAETYENQVSILGNWTNKGPALTRPKWSDITGKVDLRKDSFKPPPGWRWDSEWYISPELSMLYDKDAGHTTFLEDIYECQSRYPAGNWGPSSVPYADVKGDAQPSKDEVELAEGWQWEDEWVADLNRAVDEEGFEYAVEATMGGYGPVCKNYHLCRRRRWVRPRRLVKSKNMQVEEEKLLQEAAEGWEYAPLFRMKFHHKERKMDLVRRRRWHRKMICETASSPCFFNIQGSKDDDEEKYAAALTAPRMFLTCKKPQKYQLRAYMYQARDLLGGDSSGLSDPFARVAFLNQSLSTEKVQKTVCPTWDQTLIFESVDIHGEPQDVASKPPEIVIEIFDHDTFGSSEFIGRTKAMPVVKLDPSDPRTAVLQWFTVYKGDQYAGELLAAFELLLCPSVQSHVQGDVLVSQSNGKDLPFLPPKRGSLFTVPSGIRPVLQRTAIEIMCWGVRNMRKFQLASVTSPSIEFEVGGRVVSSKVIKNTKKNPNFDDPVLFMDIMLPKEELYTPPLNIRVRDNRQFGRKPLVGIHTVKSLEHYRCDPMYEADKLSVDLPGISGAMDGQQQAGADIVIDIPDEKSPIAAEAVDEDIDWWSKYYASVGEMDKCKQYLEHGYDKLEVFGTELEKVGLYNGFSDFCNTFELLRGKALEEEESSTVGEYKGTFKVYPLPDDPTIPLPERVLTNLPSSQPEECIIRVYVIRAFDLQPSDSSGLADPYLQVKLGKKKLDTRDDYIPNSLNPVFGKMFEMKATLPMDKDLQISVRDYDLIGSDDVVGETTVDLENRLLTRYGALVGIPKTYCISGPNAWRESRKPKELLEEFCGQNHMALPVYPDSETVKIGNKVYTLRELEPRKPSHTHLGGSEQRLALHVLNALPGALKRPLVPEHIETRPLYNPLQPGIEQGKLQMWVDMFPKSLGEPGEPIAIMPRKPKKYELRVVIYNTEEVPLDEESITGEQMSDIYVKGWLAGLDEKQETDVHYRSLDGEGNFNWRFVFPFEYIPAEEVIVIKRKEHFWNLDETELKVPPVLMIQIWDNDKFSGDDFLGSLQLKMNSMCKPAKKASSCKLQQLPEMGEVKDVDLISLFEQRRVRGFWPCYSDADGTKTIAGKVEMEIELVTEDEARERPAGTARDDPNENPHLEPPKRPETSFLWLTSPWKTMKHIIWKNYKWYFITALIVLLLLLFIVLFLYSMPGAAVSKIFGV